ncbi:MAG: DUF3172 domain-containing protein [Cyanobacteria bacterium P01_H01_bin.15]
MPRRPPPSPRYRSRPGTPSPNARSNPPRNEGNSWRDKLNFLTLSLLGVAFALGMGLGIAFTSTASFNPENVASREVIDRSAPDPELCVKFGASAIVSDIRLFVSLNPFSVYLSQPRMQPGCVLRTNNWSILEKPNLVSQEQVRDCKRRMNTFAYTGPLTGSPQISCVYQNDAAGNLFLKSQVEVDRARSEVDSF